MATVTKLVSNYSSTGMVFTNPGNVYTDDTNYATLTSTTRNQNQNSYWTNLNFAIPTDATIQRIVVSGVCRIGTSSITGAGWGIQLFHTGTTAVGTEATVSTPTLNTDYTATQTITSGFPTVAQLNTTGDSGLRVRARVYTGNTATSRTWSLDYLQVEVTYAIPAPPLTCQYTKILVPEVTCTSVISATVTCTETITCSATKILDPTISTGVDSSILTAQYTKILEPVVSTENASGDKLISLDICLTAQQTKILEPGISQARDIPPLTAQYTKILSPALSLGLEHLPLTAQNTKVLTPNISAASTTNPLTAQYTQLLTPGAGSLTYIESAIIICSSTQVYSPEITGTAFIQAEILVCSSTILLAPEITSLWQIDSIPLTCSHATIISPTIDVGIQIIPGFYAYQLGNDFVIGMAVI